MISDIFTVTPEKLTYGGDAYGRLPNGQVVFVPFAIPGETIRFRFLENRRDHNRGSIIEVVEPSPKRIQPKCTHFGKCGGCHYQHLPYTFQLEAKANILREQLQRIGTIEDPPIDPAAASPCEWNYRNNVQFHLDPEGRLGYLSAIVRKVFPIQECHLPELLLNDLRPVLQFEPGLGLDRVSLRLGMDQQVMVVLESGSLQIPELELETDLSVVHLCGEDAVVMAGEEALVMAVKNRQFQVSPASFFQVNTQMAERMVDHLVSNLPISPTDTLLDVYCGVGLFSAFFAPRAGRLIGVESSPTACRDYSINLDEFDNVELYEAPAEQVLSSLQIKPDIAILDPPRAGLGRGVVDGILACSPGKLAYVSCNPSTLGRDLKSLIAGGYRLVQVTPFDLFPQTYHIESISILERV